MEYLIQANHKTAPHGHHWFDLPRFLVTDGHNRAAVVYADEITDACVTFALDLPDQDDLPSHVFAAPMEGFGASMAFRSFALGTTVSAKLDTWPKRGEG